MLLLWVLCFVAVQVVSAWQFPPRIIGRTVLKKQHLPQHMFSGIVEEIGVIKQIQQENGVNFVVDGPVVSQDAYLGCSICLNGVCLTATAINSTQVTFGIAPETLRRSNLRLLAEGSSVNLERALLNSGRNSGHSVQGHVDCTGEIVDKWVEGNSLWFKVKVPSDFFRYVVPKGFIAIDGVSLTICEVGSDWFSFMLVPHTQSNVIIPKKSLGDLVNLELDVTAKMIEASALPLLQHSQYFRDVQDKIEQLSQEVKALKEQISPASQNLR